MTEKSTPKMIKFLKGIRNQNVDDMRSESNQKNALQIS